MNFDYCEGKVHVVKEGDTLYQISKMHNIPLAMIMRANPYVDVYNLKIGAEVCIPVMPEMPGGTNQTPTVPQTPMPMPIPMPMPVAPHVSMQANRSNQRNHFQHMNHSNAMNGQMSSDSGRSITMPSLIPNFSDSIVSYVVREGDSLNGILDRFDLELDDLLNFNNLRDVYLKAGTTLKIPEKNDEEDD